MKCPERYKIIQQNIRKPILNNDNMVMGEYHILIENQGFQECYKEKCVAWDKEKNMCKKIGGTADE